MSFSENANGMVMPVSPMYGYGGGNGGFGFGDGSGAWFLLFLLAMMGGWGNGFGGFGGGMAPYMMGANTNNDVQRGFDQSAVMNGITGLNNAVTTGFGNVQTALCSGFAGVNQGVANGFAQAEIANNARQIADMQQMYGIQSALQNCCCENRASVADLKYTVGTEACADRSAISDALQAVTAQNNANTQRILDQLCADKIAAKDDLIAQLRSELTYARGQASQDVQTAAIQAGQRALANEVEQYVLPTPRPAYIVSNPSCCNQNYGCGCGM